MAEGRTLLEAICITVPAYMPGAVEIIPYSFKTRQISPVQLDQICFLQCLSSTEKCNLLKVMVLPHQEILDACGPLGELIKDNLR